MTEAALINSEQDRDYRRQLRLEEERSQDNGKEGEGIRRALRRLAHFRRSIPHIGFVEGIPVFMAAGITDLIDYFIVGSIPIVGDILDIGIWAVIAMWVWLRAIQRPPAALLGGVIELIPFGDLLPTWMIMVLAIIIYNNSRRKFHERRWRGVIAKLKNRKDS